MIEVLDGMPEGVIGFRATGHVTGEEYKDVLLPAMEAQVEAGEVRMVYVIGPGFEKFEAGAMLQDSKAGVRLGIGHHSAWKRSAIVTDEEWIVKAFHGFAWMAPGEVATFGLDEVDAAADWAAG
jgi:hypothetical protein